MLPFFESGKFNEWAYQVGIAVDQLANAILNGSADETMSSRCFRLNYRQPYKTFEKIVNALFYPFQGHNHCYKAWVKEMTGRQRPDYHPPA